MKRAACVWSRAWSAAATAQTSARPTATPCASTTSTSWPQASSAGTPRRRPAWRRASACRPTAPTATTGRWPSARLPGRTAWMSSPWPRRTTAISRSPAAFLRGGISVVCEKPLTRSSDTAAELVEHRRVIGRDSCGAALLFRVRDGPARGPAWSATASSGTIRFVDVEHASGWAATPLELTAQAGAVAHRSRDRRVPQRGRRSRYPRLPPAALHHRPGGDPRLRRAEHPGARPARLRQRRRPAATCPTARPPHCGRAWRPPVTSTACASACSATSRAWSGGTRIRIILRSVTWTAAQRFSRRA